MGLVFSGNLIFLYLFWEIIAICCWRLIGFYRLKETSSKADKAFLVTFFGAVVMLLGFIQIYGQTGTFDLTAMRGASDPGKRRAADPLRDVLASRPRCRCTPGCPTPASRRPRSRPCSTRPCWSRSASTPTPGSSCLRLPSARRLARRSSRSIVVVSSLVAAGAALVETDFKRILAYSTVCQIGYIFLGFSVANEAGVTGSLLFILMHGLAKAGPLPLRRDRHPRAPTSGTSARWAA